MGPNPPFLGSRNPKKAISKPENPVLHLKKPISGPFTAHFKAFLRVAVRGRKWGHLGRKIDFFIFDPESVMRSGKPKNLVLRCFKLFFFRVFLVLVFF